MGHPPTDTDKLFPVFGFGGKLGPDMPANHCFAVTFDENCPQVTGMAGVLQVRVVQDHSPLKTFTRSFEV